MKILRLISRIIVGIVFIFSGIVKAVDPLGSAYKFSDYFQAFNLEFFKPFALVLAIFLFTAEFISGFALLSGYRRKTGLWGVLILMLHLYPAYPYPGNYQPGVGLRLLRRCHTSN